MSTTWRPCSSCKRPIALGQRYWVCGVSTCNRPATGFVFCKPACWDAHIGVMNHRNAWCEERTAPTSAQPGPPSAAGPSPTAGPPAADGPQRRVARPEAPPPEEGEVLIIASRLKEYIDRKSGMNTSAEVLAALSEIVRLETDRAIERARADGRRTVKGRDYRRD